MVFKNSSAALFELIQSLNSSEKRYFTTYASHYTNSKKNNSRQLFNAIAGQQEYHKNSIIQNSPLVTEGQFRNQKKYLYELVLRSLAEYHGNSTVQFKLKKALMQIKILENKNLIRPAYTLLKQSLHLAWKYEYYTTIIELLHEEMFFLEKYASLERPENWIEKIVELTKLAVDKQNVFQLCLTCRAKIFRENQKQGSLNSDKEFYKNIDALMSKDIPDPSNINHSFHSLSQLYVAKGTIELVRGNFERSHSYFLKQVQLYDDNQHQIHENQPKYFSVISNLSISQYSFGKYSEVIDSLRKIKEVKILTEELRRNIIYFVTNMELATYYQLGEVQKVKATMKQAENLILISGDHTNKISHVILLRFNLACINLLDGNYSASSRQLNNLIMNDNPEVRNDLQRAARLLYLICHYEKDGAENLNRILILTQKYFDEQDALFEIEKTILLFFNDLILIRKKSEKQNLFLKLQRSIFKILKETNAERNVQAIDVFQEWIKTKLIKYGVNQ